MGKSFSIPKQAQRQRSMSTSMVPGDLHRMGSVTTCGASSAALLHKGLPRATSLLFRAGSGLGPLEDHVPGVERSRPSMLAIDSRSFHGMLHPAKHESFSVSKQARKEDAGG